MNEQSEVMKNLSQYVSQIHMAELPSQVLREAKNHILDTFAAMISGSQLKPGRCALSHAEQQGGPPEAQVVASRLRVSAINAALANGMLAHSDETDDTNPRAGVHPGCAVVPAALAMAERENKSGTDFLRAVVLGYDIGCRTIFALGGRQAVRDRNHLPFSIGNNIGASASAGSLAGLTLEKIPYLFSFAAHQASGVMTYARDTEHIEKAFIFGGMPARNALTAAIMVQSGFTGEKDVFSGEGNFLAAYADNPKPEELTAELGSRYEVTLTNIKKYCVGGPIQLPLDGLLLIMEEHHIGADDVESILVRLEESYARTIDDREMPNINLQYIFAVTLIDGKLTYEAAHSFERMRDSQVSDIKDRINITADPELTRIVPKRHAIIEMVLKNGKKIDKRITNFRGSHDNPLSTKEVEKKASELIEPVFGADRTSRLIDAVGNLENITKIRELISLLSV